MTAPATTEDAPAARRRVLAGIFWAATTVVVFGGWFVVTRLGMAHEMTLWDVTAFRFGVGALVLLPVLLRDRLPARAWRYGLVFALLWGVPFVLLVAFGLQRSSAAHAAATVPTTMPVFAMLIAWLVLGERFGARRLAACVLIICGVAALSWLAPARAPDLVGLLALLGAAAMWAGYTLVFRGSGITPIQSAALICVWSSLLFLPAYWLFGLSRLDAASLREITTQAFYQGVLMSIVAVTTFNRAVALLGATAATAIIALVPCMAALLAIPVLGEVPGPGEALAIAVIVAGVCAAAGAPAARRQKPRS